ncbi:MAG: rhodanese-like domain-containing protein, partial [Traorella sp.]
GEYETFTPYEYAQGESEGYRIIDSSLTPSIENATYLDLVDVNGPIDGIDFDEKLLLVCNRGRKAYMLQNRLKYYGYTHTKVLEGGLAFNEIEND